MLTVILGIFNHLSLASNSQLVIISTLAVIGPILILVVTKNDIIIFNNSPEFFWSDGSIVVYSGHGCNCSCIFY